MSILTVTWVTPGVHHSPEVGVVSEPRLVFRGQWVDEVVHAGAREVEGAAQEPRPDPGGGRYDALDDHPNAISVGRWRQGCRVGAVGRGDDHSAPQFEESQRWDSWYFHLAKLCFICLIDKSY